MHTLNGNPSYQFKKLKTNCKLWSYNPKSKWKYELHRKYNHHSEQKTALPMCLFQFSPLQRREKKRHDNDYQ